MHAPTLSRAKVSTKVYAPLMATGASCGFPSPADDYVDKSLSLDELIITNAPSTFFVRASGDSMIGVGIFDGDLLVVDRSLKAVSGSIVVAFLDGETLVKEIQIRPNRVYLLPHNEKYPLIHISEASDFEVWGVVKCVVHKLHHR